MFATARRLTLTALAGLPFAVSAALMPLDVEENRLTKAEQALDSVVTRYQPMLDISIERFAKSKAEIPATQIAAREGERLWQQAVRDVQSGHWDDRSLYWGRLALRSAIKQTKPGFAMADWQKNIALTAVETNSRGMANIQFDDDTDIAILVSGFDPFFLDKDISQSNPSGLAALWLDGKTWKANGLKVQVQSVMIPVRFEDFDQGMIESWLAPVFRNSQVSMVTTISMGRDHFDLERFPGRNRSAAAVDNLNHLTGANAQSPVAPQLHQKALNGPEFIEFSLPVEAMQRAEGPWKVIDNHQVTTLEKGQFDADSLYYLQQQTSVEGSGGGYLSNEISYRSLLQRDLHQSTIAVGHIHTPRVKGYDKETEQKIVKQIHAMLTEAALAL
ncbi:hypothetical protein [Paraferrimonas sedimenticola]|uniref:Pyrrolidone-carboxylate peptidase (N-terminal pyroglutamyl peptidase) n=1 Tax=Paraferrimonas sedimenticola TaxID=375674 RepID=A0AA37VYQ3_9GAMM|nr:hypothetical protein [Paraferrimonas sedimenticola]GLP95575.1 hypothetical protein GCM10007895_08810 [Paraferrimonas sedimenticola]